MPSPFGNVKIKFISLFPCMSSKEAFSSHDFVVRNFSINKRDEYSFYAYFNAGHDYFAISASDCEQISGNIELQLEYIQFDIV